DLLNYMLKYKIPQIVTLTRKMAGGDYNGITKECDEGFYDMYDNKKGSLSANLCALRLGLEPRTL
ncbi:hypothetical protein, partial [Phocaeicola vulgatus]